MFLEKYIEIQSSLWARDETLCFNNLIKINVFHFYHIKNNINVDCYFSCKITSHFRKMNYSHFIDRFFLQRFTIDLLPEFLQNGTLHNK